jgi:hypothetical protein
MRWLTSAPVRRPLGFIEPCLPTNGRVVPTGAQWAYEIEHDRFRFRVFGNAPLDRLFVLLLRTMVPR